MNEAKGSFKGFVHQMSEVILNLLSTLYICHFEANLRKKVNIIKLTLFLFFELLDFETHVAAYSTHIRITPHIVIHLEKGFSIRL